MHYPPQYPSQSAESPRPEQLSAIDATVYGELMNAIQQAEGGAGAPVTVDDDMLVNIAPDSHEIPESVIRYRTAIPALEGQGQFVFAERLTEQGQMSAQMGLQELLTEHELPLGGVSFTVNGASGDLTGDIMPTTHGRVLALLDARFGEDDLLTEGVMKGYELARRLGLDHLWVECLHKAEAQQRTTVQMVGELDTLDAQRLLLTLQQTGHNPSQ